MTKICTKCSTLTGYSHNYNKCVCGKVIETNLFQRKKGKKKKGMPKERKQIFKICKLSLEENFNI